jgi:hypothetical protein
MVVGTVCREDRDGNARRSHKIVDTNSCKVVAEDKMFWKRDKLLPVQQARNKQGSRWLEIHRRSDHELRLAMSFARRR